MKKSYLWIIILLFAVSCAPTTALPEQDAAQPEVEQVVEPTANLSSENPESEPEAVEEVMNTAVPPTEEPVESDASMLPTELETAVPPESTKPQQASPITVDLSQLTPVADDEGEEIVQPAPGIPDAAAKLVADITTDLSTNLGIDSSEVTFKSITEVQWRDSGLGCPQPGMSYLQVITDGFQIILTVNSQDHYYHTRGTTTFIYCANPSQIVEPGTLAPNPSFNE